MQSYRQLIAWQKAMELVKRIYDTTKDFPKDEIYNLTSQIRRAAVSIEFLHHLSIAYGSLMETETQILIAESLNYLRGRGVLSLVIQQVNEWQKVESQDALKLLTPKSNSCRMVIMV